MLADVAHGSQADIAECPIDVRFTPRKRTLLSVTGMSALCHYRTHAPQQSMCGLSGQVLTDFRQEFTRAEGLRHIVITARRLRDLRLSVERIRDDRDDRGAAMIASKSDHICGEIGGDLRAVRRAT